MSRSNQKVTRRRSPKTSGLRGREYPTGLVLVVAALTFFAVMLVLIAVYFFISADSSLLGLVSALAGTATLVAGVAFAMRLEASRKSRATKELRDSEKLFFANVEGDISTRVKGKVR
jgi:hypothetical protein